MLVFRCRACPKVFCPKFLKKRPKVHLSKVILRKLYGPKIFDFNVLLDLLQVSSVRYSSQSAVDAPLRTEGTEWPENERTRLVASLMYCARSKILQSAVVRFRFFLISANLSFIRRAGLDFMPGNQIIESSSSDVISVLKQKQSQSVTTCDVDTQNVMHCLPICSRTM